MKKRILFAPVALAVAAAGAFALRGRGSAEGADQSQGGAWRSARSWFAA